MSPPGDADEVWCNDGGGLFVDSGRSVCTGSTYSVALGDLDAVLAESLFRGQ